MRIMTARRRITTALLMATMAAGFVPQHDNLARSVPAPKKYTASPCTLLSTNSSRSLVILHSQSPDNDEAPTPLCDLQTFLRLCNLVDSGGQAKAAIQGSHCKLNGAIETRRAKKLFPGDIVTFGSANLDVSEEVQKKGYVYTPKKKKVKPSPKVDEQGNLEFGGRYRSEEWRKERKQKKAERKAFNQQSDE